MTRHNIEHNAKIVENCESATHEVNIKSKLKKQIRDTTDARNMLEKVGTPPLQNVSEIKDVLTVVEKGDCLTPYQLERVEKVLVAIRRLKDYLTRGRAYDNSLAFYDENLNEIQELAEEISEKIRGGIVDNYVTFRNGRICVPVKKEYKLKVPGTVIDKSTTGNTLFIEPSGVAKYYEKLQLLKIDEENEVYRILYTLSTLVLANASAIYEDLEMIEKLDFIFSKGKLSIDMDGVEPSINTERIIHMVDARHPLMDKNIAVSLQFDIGENARGIVITGPNTGGKTVAIKTVMLNSIMAQSGLHVTCKQADICMNSSYLCDIGDGQNLSENLSTFSAHIVNVLNVLREFDKETLRPTYQMITGQAGESCAFYIADRLGMPQSMLKVAIGAAYGEEAVKTYVFWEYEDGEIRSNDDIHKGNIKPANKINKAKTGKKIWINHKRVKLHMAATELYPEDYDFSIVFDSVKNRKKRHDMGRKYTDEIIEVNE